MDKKKRFMKLLFLYANANVFLLLLFFLHISLHSFCIFGVFEPSVRLKRNRTYISIIDLLNFWNACA